MVETQSPGGRTGLDPAAARGLVARLFTALDVPSADAALVGDVLVSADMKGIRSHGVARVPYFLIRLERGVIDPRAEMSFAAGTTTTGVLDARNGIGIVAAGNAMTRAMEMAADHGSGFVAVKDSSHFGYAGYWAEMAMGAGQIGISLSNSGGRVAPTFGTEALLGTNPLALGIPGGPGGTPFLLDMATSAVAVGKVETALRESRPIPDGWILSSGQPSLDENGILSFDAPLLPLGGEGTGTGGHKGYGLALAVELLCGALGGTSFEARLAGAAGLAPPAMGHFMGALRLDGFRPPEEVHRDMEATFGRIRSSTLSPGEERIYVHGEPEALAEAASQEGIEISEPVFEQLGIWAERLSVQMPGS